jgi:hypothetical protein
MTDPAIPTTDLATRTDKVPVAFGVAPETYDAAYRMAKALSDSTIIPKDYRGKPADVLAAILMGVEVGLAPMTALQSIAVINGRPGIYGDGLLALILTSPLYVSHREWYEVVNEDGEILEVDALTPDALAQPSTRAVCEFVRKDREDPVRRMFSVAQAKRANLLNKQGPWTEYPDRMLQMRARSFAARDAFPDVLKGLRTLEELTDIPEETPPPVVRRKSETETPAE